MYKIRYSNKKQPPLLNTAYEAVKINMKKRSVKPSVKT